MPPSAFVPFCSYQTESNVLGQSRPELKNLTVCDKFEPTILEGQLCYSLDIANIVNKSTGTRTGRTNGLRILVDPNPFRLNVSNRMNPDDQSPDFKVYVHTLAQHTAYGAGAFAMSALKRMTGTESFTMLPHDVTKCYNGDFESCKNSRLLKASLKECGCLPWTLKDFKKEVIFQL